MIGDSLKGYLLLEELGRGGMSRIYKAESESGELLVIKCLDSAYASDPVMVERFRRENETLRTLQHAHIVQVLSPVLEDQGALFYAMEWMAGGDLKQRLAKEPALSEILTLFLQALDGLAYAHEQGVVHRDLKPANIFINAEGLAKMGDFGLAQGQDRSQLTATGTVLGTPEYMSPEQAEGEPATAQSDIYACGVMLYEFLTGAPPFRAEQALTVLRMHVDKAAPPLPAEAAASGFSELLSKALAKAPAERWRSVREFRQAIEGASKPESFAGETKQLDVGPAPKPQAAPPAPRGRAMAFAAAFVAVLIFGPWLVFHQLIPRKSADTKDKREALGPVFAVKLKDGESFQARAVDYDMEAEELIFTLEDGTERRLSMDAVLKYERRS